MRLLLDTHAFLWFVKGDDRLTDFGCRAMCLFLSALLVLASGMQGIADESASSETLVGELPRYRHEVGQELVYELTSVEDLLPESDDDNVDETQRQQHRKWWVWVTKQNEDGSWRLLIRKQIKNLNIPAEGVPQATFENDFLGYCDLTPDGSFAPNATLGGHIYFKTHPEELLVRFPDDNSGIHESWNYHSPVEDAHYSYRAEAMDGDVLTIIGGVVRPEDANYERRDSYTIYFDLHRGIVSRIVKESKTEGKTYRYPWHTRSTFQLTAVNERDSDWIAQLDREGALYLDASKVWWQASSKAARARTKDACQRVLDETRGQIVEAMQQTELPEIQQIFGALLTLHDREGNWALDEAAQREELYAKPALNWKTTDFDGRQHQLIDYRGKIVLMDFWYRGCGHCIKALPKVEKLERQYEGRDVVVLGINNDQNDDDARFVIDTYELRYANLRAGDIPKQYGVNTWPTFIVLDQTGRIAEYQSGNSDDLYENVTNIVDALLASPATEPPRRFLVSLPVALAIAAVIAVASLFVIRRTGAGGTPQLNHDS